MMIRHTISLKSSHGFEINYTFSLIKPPYPPCIQTYWSENIEERIAPEVIPHICKEVIMSTIHDVDELLKSHWQKQTNLFLDFMQDINNSWKCLQSPHQLSMNMQIWKSNRFDSLMSHCGFYWLQWTLVKELSLRMEAEEVSGRVLAISDSDQTHLTGHACNFCVVKIWR